MLMLSMPYTYTGALAPALPDTERPASTLPHASTKPTTLIQQDYGKSARMSFQYKKSTRLGLTPTQKTSTALALQD
jgi:hypothetical protein